MKPSKLLHITFSLLFISPIASCKKKRTGDVVKVRYAVSPFQDTLLPVVADELGWDKEVGLDVEIVVLGWTEVQEAVASGSADVGISNMSAIVATHDRAPDLIYLYGLNTFDNGFALMVRPDSTLKTIDQIEAKDGNLSHEEAVKLTARQLEGRTVVTTSNTDMEQGVAAACGKGGVEFATVKIIDLPPEEGLAAFINGTGDAYIGGIPQRTKAGKEGMIEMLSGADLGPPPINGIITTQEYYESNKETLHKLINLWFRTVIYIDEKEGPSGEKGSEIIVRALNKGSGGNFNEDDFWKFWNNYEHYPSNLEQVEAQILDPSGENYWKSRWDDCNNYFSNIVHRIERPVPSEDAFRMVEMHEFMKKAADAN